MLTPRRSWPIGGDRTLVQLETREYVCVDMRSLDALAYMLGWDLETNVVQVFRTFLMPSSVVLDIGASFGLYTAIAANRVRRHGRLYAFEGNPEVFPSLTRTLLCNGIHGNPNVVGANLLVSDSCGRGILHFGAEAFHLGTMSDVPLWGGERRSVEVEMTTIDAFLPSDIAVDLVKVDVEGHEPLVIRGMERTIARSPNIRLIIEFADDMLAQTMKAPDFVRYIHSLGFCICRILPAGGLALVEPGEEIAGFNNCLLTRTPQQDVAAVERRRRSVRLRLQGLLSRFRRSREDRLIRRQHR
jgi:FkbM family methyltransferase